MKSLKTHLSPNALRTTRSTCEDNVFYLGAL
jgi:hypothetical protein